MAKKVVKKEEASLPATIDFSGDAGKGLEGADKETFAIPFLSVLQSNSPQVEDETVEGAKSGLLFNTITNELFTSALIIPCAYERRYLQWAQRSQGGGFKGQHLPVDIDSGTMEDVGMRENEKGRIVLMLGDDELKDTRHHFVLVQGADGSWQPALISLSSTQIKKSKRFMSRINCIELQGASGPYKPPSFSHVYKISTVKEENNEGKWHGVQIDMVGPVTDSAVYDKARAFHATIKDGKVETAPPTEEGAATDDEKF